MLFGHELVEGLPLTRQNTVTAVTAWVVVTGSSAHSGLISPNKVGQSARRLLIIMSPVMMRGQEPIPFLDDDVAGGKLPGAHVIYQLGYVIEGDPVEIR